MKALLALLVFAFCAAQLVSCLSNLEILVNGITKRKNDVRSTLNSLERHKRDFTFNLNIKLSTAKTNSMQNINSIVNPAIQAIEADTKESTAEGKDASHCYEAARLSLRELSLTGFSDLDDCQNVALNSVKPSEQNIDSTVLAGNQVITYYDSIVPSCFSTSTQQMESCIVGKLPQGDQLAKTFQSTSTSVISSSNSAASAAVVNVSSCNFGPVNTVRDGTTKVRIAANACIAAL